jgi:hypothetical protein
MKRPAFQFYPADWRKDAALQSCSIAAQGLWINILCIAHECEPYGHLMINGKPMSGAQIGRLVGLSAKDCDKLLVELQAAGVLDKTPDAAIYSRRMVRDEEIRNRRAAGGGEGAAHGIKGAEHGLKGGRPKTERGVIYPPLKPPPSSSSSSSTSIKESAQKIGLVDNSGKYPKPDPRSTVPGKPGRDPEIQKAERDMQNRAAPSAEVLAAIARIKQKIARIKQKAAA